MDSNHREQTLGPHQEHRLDAVVDSTGYEVIVGARDARGLRAALMRLSRVAADAPRYEFVLVLVEPVMSESRLVEEWRGAMTVFRPELVGRISLAIIRGGSWSGLPEPPAPAELSVLNLILDRVQSEAPPSARRSSISHFEILRILISFWLHGEGPVRVNRLIAASGSSYPTVSRALKRYEYCLKRHSDRRVELAFFPKDEWNKLLALADQVRSSTRFVDRSGSPRSLESYLRRLLDLDTQQIAVGGIAGALHHHPPLDIVDSPRLDLSVHVPDGDADLSFVAKLDPALEPAERRDESPRLIVHLVQRAESFFQLANDGTNWADPVECLLDLHGARLESQAQDFLHAMQQRKNRP